MPNGNFSGVISGIVGDNCDIEGGNTIADGGWSKDSVGKFGDVDELSLNFAVFNAAAAAIAANAGLALATSASAGFDLAAKANAGFEASKLPKRFAGVSEKVNQ